jgi:hypothetical protein
LVGVLKEREGEDQATHQGNGQQSDHPKPGPTHAIAMLQWVRPVAAVGADELALASPGLNHHPASASLASHGHAEG